MYVRGDCLKSLCKNISPTYYKYLCFIFNGNRYTYYKGIVILDLSQLKCQGYRCWLWNLSAEMLKIWTSSGSGDQITFSRCNWPYLYYICSATKSASPHHLYVYSVVASVRIFTKSGNRTPFLAWKPAVCCFAQRNLCGCHIETIATSAYSPRMSLFLQLH